MQCYIILYSQEGYFLIFEKRDQAFFFQGTNGGPGTIYYPDGIPIQNGPGLFAFPGGGLHNGEEPFQGCLREFTEECGNDILFHYLPLNQPRSLLTLNNVTINNAPYDILYSSINTVGTDYYSLYLEFSTDDLREIQNIVMNTNLDQANQAGRDIHYNEIQNYNEIFAGYPFCPLDDELGSVQLWQIQREINEIRQLDQNQATDWYYDMIVYMANTLLNANIPY